MRRILSWLMIAIAIILLETGLVVGLLLRQPEVAIARAFLELGGAQ